MRKSLIGAEGTGVEDIIINGETGLIVKNDDEKALANAINTMLTNPPLMKKLSENAYQNVSTRFSMQTKIKQLLSFYNQILQMKGRV